MHLVLDGWSAFEYWMNVTERPAAGSGIGQPTLTSFEDISCKEVSDRIARQDGVPGCLHLIVKSPADRRQADGIICESFSATKQLPPKSVQQIGTGIYTVTPELLVLRLAVQLPRLTFLRAFTDLLGIFALSYLDRQSLISRKPLLTKQDMVDYLATAKGIPGSAIVKQALGWVVEKSASPRETSMDLELALPSSMGGQGMPPFEANKIYDKLSPEVLQLARKSFLVADVAWDDESDDRKPLLFEYNSSKYHDNEEQKEFDFDKIAAMQLAGKTVTPITTHNYNSYESFASIVQGARKQLHIRNRTNEQLEEKRRRTHEELLRIERQQRELHSLNETSRWQFLRPLLFTDDETPPAF